MAYKKRDCVVCTRSFTPPHRANRLTTDGNHLTHCPSCRREIKAALEGEQTTQSPTFHNNAAPLKQVVFDLETWGLDAGWGVVMQGDFLEYGHTAVPRRTSVSLRDFKPWKEGRRSDDSAMVKACIDILNRNHLAYAHNGQNFDIRWLRTVAMKHQIPFPQIKLIDPAQVAWQKYRLGRNSLEAIADFLELPYEKYHIAPNVWRKALMDDDDEMWKELAYRCSTDVDLLNAVAGAVTGDVGMIDFKGSGR